MPVPGLENPDMAIVPNPCDEAATNRNWDNVRRIMSQIVTVIQEGAGTLMASCTLQDDPLQCVPDLVTIGNFRPFCVQNPSSPVQVPTQVRNRLGIAVSGNPYALLARDPTQTAIEDQWEIVNVFNVSFTAVSAVTKSGAACTYDFGVFSAPTCNANGSTTIFTTTTARAIRELFPGCISGNLLSNEVEVEVFSKTLDETDYIEFEWDTLLVLTDVYQSVPYGNIIGFYYRVYVPCVDLVGEDTLIFVDRCA